MAVDVGTTYVIVAIPASDDPSWKASSEKIPHVTLLYLGDQLANVDRVQKFIKHAVDTTMHPFVLDGDHRGALGKNPVEVLFFKPYGIDKLDDFRTHLLSNNDIHLSYNSTTQFPEWVPHLTLGSADVPAKEDEATYPGTTSVYFDRIALWRGNYEGVEFPMKPSTDPLAMSVERGANFLSHHGVKGMHWGQRHAEKKAAKAGKKWVKAAGSDSHFAAVHNAAANRMNHGELERLNNKPQYKKADFTNDSPLRRRYYDEYNKTFLKAMNEESDKLLGPSPDGSSRVDFHPSSDGETIEFTINTIKHADEEHVVYRIKKDATGHIVSVALVPDTMAHSGVKGMHWGVRHDPVTGGVTRTAAREAKVTAKAGSNDAKLKTVTENNRRAQVADKLKRKQLVDLQSSKDAKEANFVKVKAKVSGVNSLSNQDLQQLITRMSLERQFKDLKKIEHEETLVGAGKKWAGNFINDVAKDTAASWLKRPGGASADRGPIKVKAWTTGNQFADALDGPHKAIGK